MQATAAITPLVRLDNVSKHFGEGETRVDALRAVSIEVLPQQVVALLGLTLYPIFFPSGVSSGPGLKPDRIHGAEVYVLPNPSGRNRAYPGFERKLIWYRDLASHLPAGPGDNASG